MRGNALVNSGTASCVIKGLATCGANLSKRALMGSIAKRHADQDNRWRSKANVPIGDAETFDDSPPLHDCRTWRSFAITA